MSYELSIEKLSEKEIEIFTKIKATAYADDRLKVEFDDIEKPSWFDGEWYVGLGILNIEETKRLMKEFSCYLIYRMEEAIGGLGSCRRRGFTDTRRFLYPSPTSRKRLWNKIITAH